MESLNLNTLVTSLPSQQNAEKELMNDFKAAALSITTLYRSSRKNAKRAYNAGYATACQDLLNFIQHGVSAGDPSLAEAAMGAKGSGVAVDGDGMTIGRVMDWTEARLDAIKAVEEDEDEDEEREKEKERSGRSRTTTAQAAGGVKPEQRAAASQQQAQGSKKPAAANAAASTSTSRTLPSVSISSSTSSLPITPRSPQQLHQQSTSLQRLPEQPSSPSPPPPRTLHAQAHAHRHPYQSSQHRQSKVRTAGGGGGSKAHQPIPQSDAAMIPFVPQSPTMSTAGGGAAANGSSLLGSVALTASDGSLPSFNLNPSSPSMDTTPSPMSMNMSIGAGAKRRHAMMMMMDGSPSAGAVSGDVVQRRRTRSTRGLHAHGGMGIVGLSAGAGQASEDMDVEEDGGRERKRVARR